MNNGIRFFRQDKQLDIDGEIVSTLWQLFALFDGYRDLNDIAKITKFDVNYIKEIILDLESERIVNDSREQYKHFHEISNYPPRYFRLLSEEEVKKHKNRKDGVKKIGDICNYNYDNSSHLFKLISNRKSCRNFSSEKKLSLSQLGKICDYGYSKKIHATPSGGSLYPLKIYCIVVKKQEDFDIGYYEYDAEMNNFVLFNKNIDLEQLKYCYNDESLAFNSPIQIIIAADLDRHPYKYSNRGYRLTLIEAGQVAQNISLCCEENGLSCCELGGILDIPLTKELDLIKSNIRPILGIAVGYSSFEKLFKYSTFLSSIVNNYVGDNKQVKSFGTNYFDIENSSFYGAWAKYGNKSNRIAGATGFSYNEAVCKAIIEAYERYCSSMVRIDYTGTINNESLFLNPNEIAPLSKEQRILWNLPIYDNGDVIDWTRDITGKYYAPTDFVFYGHVKKNKLFLSDSSGIAAYTNYEEAKKRALAELIERDAIMQSWYKKDAPKHVDNSLLPTHIINRIRHWKEKGREVHILVFDSYIPVFLTIIIGCDYPCFVSGAACSFDSVNDAMIKSLQEAEYNLLLSMENPIDNPPSIEEIKSPIDHGQYYHFYQNMNKISWLWSNNNLLKHLSMEKYNFDDLCKKLDVVFFDLSLSGKDMIKVVRAISKKLVPISFGYNRDYYLHPILNDINNDTLNRRLPHYFA